MYLFRYCFGSAPSELLCFLNLGRALSLGMSLLWMDPWCHLPRCCSLLKWDCESYLGRLLFTGPSVGTGLAHLSSGPSPLRGQPGTTVTCLQSPPHRKSSFSHSPQGVSAKRQHGLSCSEHWSFLLLHTQLLVQMNKSVCVSCTKDFALISLKVCAWC